MYGDRELEAKIKEYEDILITEELRYTQAVKAHKNYDTLRAIRNNIQNVEQELHKLYSSPDGKV